MKRSPPSIHLLVSLIVLLPIVVVSAALLTLSSYTSKRIESEMGAALVRTTADKVHVRLIQTITDAERTSDLYTHRIQAGTLPPEPSPDFETLMYESMLIRPAVGSITFAWPDGRCRYVMRDGGQYVVGRSGGSGPQQTQEFQMRQDGRAAEKPLRTFTFDAQRRPWYLTGLGAPNGIWTDVYLWFGGTPTAIGRTRIASIAYTRAVYSEGKFVGVLMVDVTLPQVSQILADTEIAQLGSMFIVDQHDRVLAASNRRFVRPGELPSIWLLTNPDAVAAAGVLHQQTGPEHVFVRESRQIYVQDMGLSSSVPWKMIAVLPDSPLTKHIRAVQRNAVAAGALLVLGAVVVGLLLAQTLSRPIRQLASHVRSIGRGEFDQKARLYSTAEFAQLSHAVNEMTTQLKEQVRLRAQIEAARRAHETKSAFFNRVTHELRTPLNAIIGYSELLDEQACVRSDPLAREDVRRVLQASRQLLQLINDLLDLAKAEAGRMRIQRAHVELKDLVREVEETVRPLIRQQRNDLIVKIDSDGTLYTDRSKLRQILLNLLSNAGKFTTDGTVTLRARCDGSHAHFNVTDTGIGIPSGDAEAMFEPFRQADIANIGTGLGLTIARQYVQLLGGDIELNSALGAGTSVDVYLPVAQAPADVEPIQ